MRNTSVDGNRYQNCRFIRAVSEFRIKLHFLSEHSYCPETMNTESVTSVGGSVEMVTVDESDINDVAKVQTSTILEHH